MSCGKEKVFYDVGKTRKAFWAGVFTGLFIGVCTTFAAVWLMVIR